MKGPRAQQQPSPTAGPPHGYAECVQKCGNWTGGKSKICNTCLGNPDWSPTEFFGSRSSPTAGTATCDAEVNALARIHGELLAFDDAARARMLRWLGARLPTDPQSAPPPSTGEPAGLCHHAYPEGDVCGQPRDSIRHRDTKSGSAAHAFAGESVGRSPEARLDAIRTLLESNGCDCECYCDRDGVEHNEDCDRCLACRVEGAMQDTAAPTGELVRREDVVRWLRLRWEKRFDEYPNTRLNAYGLSLSLADGSWLRDLAALDSPAPDAGQTTKGTL